MFKNITVTDKDTTGSNIEVECETLPIYSDACDVFGIEAVTSEQNLYQGAIVLKKKLNYTEQQLYEFILKATVSLYFYCDQCNISFVNFSIILACY